MISVRGSGTRSASRTYKDALDRLNSLQTCFETLEKNRRTGCKPQRTGADEARRWLEKIGYSVTDLKRLKVIHVAGTKGKGGTCCFVDSILREYRLRTCYPQRVGLYTSPHIKHVRERIQINSEPITEEVFTQYFFKSWDKIAPMDTLDPNNKPGYFRFLTLISFDVFLEQNVDIAIYETGVGGEFDATNIIETPLATGITKLGMDHDRELRVPPNLQPPYFTLETKPIRQGGATIEEIAWHKSGIFKTGCSAFSSPQHSVPRNILGHRADERGVDLQFIKESPELSMTRFPTHEHRENAALAMALVNTSLHRVNKSLAEHSLSTKDLLQTLEYSSLPGRCQLLQIGAEKWYLDGAHTEDSLAVTSRWYADATRSASLESPSTLIFNQQSQRNGDLLLKSLFLNLQRNNIAVHHAIFCTNKIHGPERADFADSNTDPAALLSLHVQYRYSILWKELDPSCDTHVAADVDDAIMRAREVAKKGMPTLVTGSFHLVGAVLYLLESIPCKLSGSTVHH